MFFIRADSNPIISGGHIMRCLAIANALIERGEKVCFLVADENPIPVLEDAEISYIILHSKWQDPMTDVEQVKSIISRDRHPVLLIDTYRITREYVEEVKAYCKVIYLGSKQEYLGELNLLINYSTNIDYDFYYRNYDKSTTLLLGPSYAPLRKEFQNVVPVYKNQVDRILITTGNTDYNHMAMEISKALQHTIARTSIKLDIIVGRMFDDAEELHSYFDNMPNVTLYDNVKLMSLIMKECDLAISANGTTVYELSAMGIPTISFAMVDEQLKSAEALSQLGVIDYCGRSFEDKNECVSQIIKRVTFYLENNNSRIELARKAHKLIDGNGVNYIIDTMLS